ncbi:MAG TPA: VOC family protein [Anaeromyxobacteraceae bacterium]|nr:VOC family protein [Anaeromyxobacteraceae bacterium]
MTASRSPVRARLAHMIDHMTLTVRDYARSVAFYKQALAPLGYGLVMEFDGACGFGEPRKPSFWMKQGDPPTTPQHIAFRARRRADVDAFHAAALAAGGRDNGAPGLRPDYHPTYYAAFVFDPDGHPIEAVNHHEPASAAKPKRTAARKPAARKAKAAARGKKTARRARR